MKYKIYFIIIFLAVYGCSKNDVSDDENEALDSEQNDTEENQQDDPQLTAVCYITFLEIRLPDQNYIQTTNIEYDQSNRPILFVTNIDLIDHETIVTVEYSESNNIEQLLKSFNGEIQTKVIPSYTEEGKIVKWEEFYLNKSNEWYLGKRIDYTYSGNLLVQTDDYDSGGGEGPLEFYERLTFDWIEQNIRLTKVYEIREGKLFQSETFEYSYDDKLAPYNGILMNDLLKGWGPHIDGFTHNSPTEIIQNGVYGSGTDYFECITFNDSNYPLEILRTESEDKHVEFIKYDYFCIEE